MGCVFCNILILFHNVCLDECINGWCFGNDERYCDLKMKMKLLSQSYSLYCMCMSVFR